jgi:hypothetical protein
VAQGPSDVAPSVRVTVAKGGRSRDQLKRLKEPAAENLRLRRAVSDLRLDKMIPAEAARGNVWAAPGVHARIRSALSCCVNVSGLCAERLAPGLDGDPQAD